MNKEGFINSLATKGQEVGYVLGTGTIAWMVLFGPTNPQLFTRLLLGSGVLILGGSLAKQQKAA